MKAVRKVYIRLQYSRLFFQGYQHLATKVNFNVIMDAVSILDGAVMDRMIVETKVTRSPALKLKVSFYKGNPL